MRPAVQLQQQVRVCLEISWCAGKVRMPGVLRRGRIRHNHLTLHAAKHGDAGAESRADTSFLQLHRDRWCWCRKGPVVQSNKLISRAHTLLSLRLRCSLRCHGRAGGRAARLLCRHARKVSSDFGRGAAAARRGAPAAGMLLAASQAAAGGMMVLPLEDFSQSEAVSILEARAP